MTQSKILPPSVSALIMETLSLASREGVTLTLGGGGKVLFPGTAIECSGFFDDRIRTLAVAIGRPVEDWVPIFVHEGCHMDQWLEGAEVWKAMTDVSPGDDSPLDDWLGGKDVPADLLDRCTRATIAVEADCEKRVIEKIRSLALPIDERHYAKQANAYVLSYHYIRESRTWPTNPSAYGCEEIMAAMPTTLEGIDHLDRDYAMGLVDWEGAFRRAKEKAAGG